MSFLYNLLIVIFVLNCLFLLFFILIQSGKSSSINLFGGSSQTAFGSNSADVLTKATSFMVFAFIILALLTAYMKSIQSKSSSLEREFTTQDASSPKIKVNEIKPLKTEKEANQQDKPPLTPKK